MQNETLWPPILTTGDIASHMLRCMTFHGTASIPQPLIDRFGGTLRAEGTHASEGSGWGFRVTGSYINGSAAYESCGTLSVSSFGLNLYGEDNQKYYWVDFIPEGDDDHREMHYHEPSWNKGSRVYSSRNPIEFWESIEKWQSPEYTRFLRANRGNEENLFRFI